jgi:hypothetical protein
MMMAQLRSRALRESRDRPPLATAAAHPYGRSQLIAGDRLSYLKKIASPKEERQRRVYAKKPILLAKRMVSPAETNVSRD